MFVHNYSGDKVCVFSIISLVYTPKLEMLVLTKLNLPGSMLKGPCQLFQFIFNFYHYPHLAYYKVCLDNVFSFYII